MVRPRTETSQSLGHFVKVIAARVSPIRPAGDERIAHEVATLNGGTGMRVKGQGTNPAYLAVIALAVIVIVVVAYLLFIAPR